MPADTHAATPRRLEGRVAIVTGGGRGIGESIVRRFAENGAKVLVATRTEKYGADLVEEIRGNGDMAELITVELGDRQAAHAIVQRAADLWGGVDILVHNAAYVPHSMLIDTEDSEFAKAMDVSVNTGFWLIKECYPYLKQSKAGRVLMTSSLCADKNHLPGLAHYAASKGAINALIRGAAVELAKDHITSNGVAPGGTMSASLAAAMSADAISAWEKTLPLGRIGAGSDIANAMLYLASDDAAYVTGQILTVDGGQSLGQPMNMDADGNFG